jgi:hypothetical protein
MSPRRPRKTFEEIFVEQIAPPFTGEIWEFFKDVPMGRGFANEGHSFEIESAYYLKEPQREIRRRPYGKFIIRAAVQMLKTNGTVEQPAGYFIGNDPGDMIIYLSGDDTAFDQAKARAMPYLKANPKIAELIDAVVSKDSSGRHQITTSEFYLPDMVLRIWPLNLTTTQRMTLRYVFISDAFLSGRTGMIKEAIARTTQHNTNQLKDYKVVIESQGGEEDDDFDSEWKTTDQRMLHVVCPYCGTGQQFEWHHQRPDDFVAVPTKDIPDVEKKDWVERFTPILKSKERRHCGMKRGDDDKIKHDDNTYNEQAVQSQTYYECYHCGSSWHDTPDIRLALDKSSYYVPTNPRAVHENIGWWWPAWAGQRIPWGSIMLEYLQAKESQLKGLLLPLKLWYQKRAAAVWSDSISHSQVEVTPMCYETDPTKMIPDFFARYMGVDSQKDIAAGPKDAKVGSFWWIIREFDKYGNSRQLARGFADSWEKWIAAQKLWKVANQCVVIDASWGTPQIEGRGAAAFEMVTPGKPHPITGRKDPFPSCWRLFFGSPKSQFRVGKKLLPISAGFETRPYFVKSLDGHQWRVKLFRYWWSNFVFEQQLEAILSRSQGMPTFDVLAREQSDTPEVEVQSKTYEQQISSRYPQKVRGVSKYVNIANRVAHYRDCELQILARASQDGLLGHIKISEE